MIEKTRISSVLLASLLIHSLVILHTKAVLVHEVDERPRIVIDNGDLLLVAARGKDVKFQVLEEGRVYLNNEDLVQLVQTMKQSAGLIEDSEGGTLSNLQRTITKLNNAVFGKNGLGTRVSLLEQGTTNSTTGVESSGNILTKISALNTKIANVRRSLIALRNKLKANECSSNPCHNGGTCEDSYDSFICRCPPNWEGILCDTDVNECGRFAGTDLGCQNGATCVNKPGTYECTCAAGWFGIHCTQNSNACTGSASRDLCGHGMCVNQPNTRLGYSCICEQGWTKDSVTQACTLDVDECASNHPSCSRSPAVPCVNVPGSFYCGACPQGYTGSGYYCSDIDECQVNNGGCSMNPTVQCINTQGSRMCGICPPGYQGDGVTCSYRGACQINNGGCHYLARCVENQAMGPSYVQCICPAGYVGSGIGDSGCVGNTGVLPSTNPCSSNPCVHGTCTAVGSAFVCSCIQGYTGPTCSIAVNPCAINPCKNGGTCVANLGTYHCRCLSNSTGPNCEQEQSGCGGWLNSEEGSLRFPPESTTQSYPHNTNCAWVIVTNVTKVINVTFSSFNIERTPDCLYDWLQIHDGRGSGDRLFDRYCGTDLPNNGTIISTHNMLYMWFRSDRNVNKEGFSLSWTSVDPVCGGSISFTSHGSLSSPGYPGKYPKNRDCLWRLQAPPSRRIQFNFVVVKLENHANCSYDFLEITDGFRTTDVVLEKFCTTSNPTPIMTSGPSAIVRFHSDNQSSDGGFLVSYNSVPGVAGCGGTMTGSSGTITCPTERGRYRGNLDCEWVIQVPKGSRIRITFTSFHLEQSRDCRFDKVEIHDGPHPTSPLVGRHCGNAIPRPYTSHKNELTITFQSDWSGHGDGFQILYEEVCGDVYGDATGVIKSPNYPNDYPTNKQCIYEIAQPLGKSIILEFYDFNLEYNPSCNYDFLEIRDGHDSTSPLKGIYCTSPPPTIISTHNYLWLKFQTDFSRHGRGFYANYTTQDISCGGIAKNRTGVIESPHYPNLNSHNHLCRWVIAADVGHVVRLTWQNFDLENSYHCMFDFVEVYDNTTVGNGTKIDRYCGTQKPPDITSTNNILTLVFSTDRSIVSTGFQVTYTQLDTSQLCGGNYFSPVGVLRSPGYPNSYPHSKDCTWVLKVPSGQQLKLNVTDFQLEYHTNCRWDYLEIRNGDAANSPLIGKYCGNNIPQEIIAMSNQLYLRFKSDYSRSAKGFEISWDGTATGCGGTLSGSQGSIRSPNYPQPYSAFSECFWRISTSQGSTIQIVFVELELERSQRCSFDYLAFYDGVDSSAKLLGKFCQTGNTLTLHSTSNHMFIKFRSDSSNQGNGFHINYATTCNTEITGYNGVIESPNFPSSYPSHLNCKWNINVPKGNKVNITFSHFVLERKPCRFDYLQVSEALSGESYTTPLTEKLCGSETPPPIHSSMNKVQVAMVSDFSVAHSGFRLEWVLDGCGGVFARPTGEFTSPGYPGGYREDSECHWKITAPLDQSVQLTIEDLVLEGRPNCEFDSVTIYGGPDTTSPKLHEPLCHTLSQPLVTTSSGNSMYVIFKSDMSYSGKGFKATYKTVASRCGGLFNAPQGRIHSRNYPNNYDPYDDCLWLIQVDVNHVVQLTFTDFDLELHNQCRWDYVKVFDGNTTESPLLATLCGNSMPNVTTYRSTGNVLLVRMKADGSNSLKGFAANFTTACGARIVTEDTGIIDLSSSVNVNNENVNCSWIIAAARPENHVTLTITHMDLSPAFENFQDVCDYAYVEVLDGEDKDAPSKGRFCGSRAPPQMTSMGSTLFVHMVSLYGAHHGHFTATYSVYSNACGGNLTSEHGAFASPNYPATYPLNAECVWTITTAPGNRAMVVFRTFGLEQSASCNKDYVEVREGDGAGKVIGIYCTDIPSNVTASQNLWIKFRSDTDESAAGFIADYSLVHGNDLSGPSGEIASPLYPRSYIQEGDFSWRITVGTGKAIRITFTDFFIEKYMDHCDLHLAIYDGYDETGVEIFKGCGFSIPDPVTSYSNVIYIVMHSMAYYHGSKFKLQWLEVERVESPGTSITSHITSSCSGRIYLTDGNVNSDNSSYVIESPGYPHGYAQALQCEWIVETPPLSHAQFIVHNMDLETGYGGCYFDNVQVFSGVDGSRDWRLLKTLCLANATDEDPIEATNLMKVVFSTDYSNNKTGFSGTVRSVCGGAITASNGVIEVSNITRYMVNCQWNITVRSGRTIAVTFDRFQVPADRSGTCSNTYLMLRNGLSESSPILGLGKYCSTSNPVVPHTTSNHLYIRYRDFGGSAGFKMRFSEVSIACGGRFTLTPRNNMVNISSPNFPNMPFPHSECTWIILAPGGERLQVDFDDRFNFFNDECNSEYLELRDGGTEISPLIDRFCSVTPNTQTTTGNALFVRYFTDIDNPHTGFKANISIARCGGTVRGQEGEVRSPNYPREYPSNTECIWRIVGTRNHILEMQFQDLHLPTDYNNCSGVDSLSVTEVIPYNNTKRLVQTLCGSAPQPNILVAANEALLKFKTGAKQSHFTEYRGFYLNFSTSYDQCGGELTTPEGQIQSPGYPNGLRHYRYCEWTITVPKGRRVTVDILDLDMDFQGGTNLIFFNNDFRIFIVSLKSNSTLRRIESSSYRMVVYYFSHFGSGHRGFRATYSSNEPETCGGELVQDSGTISMSSSNNNVEPLYCEWRRVNRRTDNHTFVIKITQATVGYDVHTPYFYRATKLKVSVDELVLGEIHKNTTQEPVFILSPFSSTTLMGSQTIRSGPLNFTAEYQTSPCGGVLNGPEQIITSPGFPSNYAPNLHCAWAVTFPEGQAISVRFTNLNLETNCAHDYVVIYNGPSPTAPRIGHYCGSTVPQQFNTMSNELWLEFHSDQAVQNQGFKVQLTAVTEGCGGIFHSNTGLASSPNFPNSYRNNDECEWDIRVDNGYFIQLNFIERFKLEDSPGCVNDYIEIFDYRDNNYVSMAKYCGPNTPAPVNSSSSRMKILFRSNDRIVADGFKVRWNVHCGGIIENVKSGTLVSPGYPGIYENSLYCNYTVSIPGHFIRAYFESFHLERGYQGCRYDNVTVYTPNFWWHNNMNKVGTYCGTDTPPEIITMNEFQLIFQTDSWGRYNGFLVKFETLLCGGNITTPGPISLPRIYIPDTYIDLNCTWVITAPANNVVVARFSTLETESYGYCYSYHSVMIYSGRVITDDSLLGKFCGNLTASPPIVRSNTNGMVLNFLTYTSSMNNRFTADIRFTYGEDKGCGGTINATSTAKTVRSPDVNGDNKYEASLDCHWLVKAPEDKILNFQITSFQVEPCANLTSNSPNYCACDFLEVYDGPSQYSQLIDRFCGSAIPSAFSSSTNHLWIRFVSDGQNNGRGFVAQVSAQNSLCGPARLNVTTTPQVLTSLNYPNNYPNNLRCRWLLEDQEHTYKGLEIHVEDVDIQGGGEKCSQAKLEISDVESSSYISEGLGQNYVYSGRYIDTYSIAQGSYSALSAVTFCGQPLSHNFYSTSNAVMISLTTGNVPSKGFKLQYSLPGCNRNYTGVQGRIRLSHLPTSCTMLIETSQNRTISLYFGNMYITHSENCQDRGVEVLDGASASSPRLGRFCGSELSYNAVSSTGPTVRINIWDQSEYYSHVDMTYTTTDQGSGCGGVLFNYGGILTSPFYPSNYRNASVCRWQVTVPEPMKAVLKFQTFNLGTSSTCATDFVELLDVDPTTKAESVRVTYCGGDNPPPFIGTTSILVLRYTVSVHNSGSGWAAMFSGKPPGVQLYEELQSFDNYDNYY